MVMELFLRLNSKTRQGFLLPVILALIIVLLLMSATRLYLSRHNLNTSQRLSDRERAYQVAASALETICQKVDSSISFINDPSPETFPKIEKSTKELREIIEALLNEDGLFTDCGISIPIESVYSKFIVGVSDAKELSVELTLTQGKEISPPVYSSLLADGQEKDHLLSITATAEAGKSKCRVTTFKRLKVVNITPPLVGKFSLFLHSPGVIGTNGLNDSSLPEKLNNTPLTIYSGSTAAVSSIEPERWGEFIDNQGWIYLGSNNNWVLGASMGGGRENSMEGLLKSDVFTYPLESDSYLDSIGSISYYSRQENLFQELGESSEREVLKLRSKNDYGRSSLLNLTGSNINPSPTLILGNVHRRWALIQGLIESQKKTIAPLPWLDESTFENGDWPGQVSPKTIQSIKRHFNHSYEWYSERMSNLVKEPFNNANLAALLFPTDDENKIISGDYSTYDDSSSDSTKQSLPKSMKISSKGDNIEFHKLANVEKISLKNNEGNVLADNCPISDMRDYSFLIEKAAFLYENYADFLEDHTEEDGSISLSGIVYIDSDLELTKRTIIHSGNGGIIISGGDITIKGPISCQGNEPFTLLSIKGNILVETEGKVDAALVALSGGVSLKKTCEIYGLVAANSLEIEESKNSESKSITYNRAFDPTNYENYKRNYRITVEKRWKSFVH